MIRPIPRRSGVRYAVNYRPVPGEGATTRTFHSRAAAKAFDELANARWPLEPLVTACGHDPDNEGDLEAWAAAHGINGRELGYARRDGGLTDTQADYWATRAHLHPTQVWGWAWITTGLLVAQIDNDQEAA
jgi:hypothetical protein